ncbi:MAG: transporter, partial [Burkholderiales bacterium PBB5]
DRCRLVAEQLLPAAEQVAAGAELAYRRGASSALELLDARRSLRAVHLEQLTADADLAKALADRRAAAGEADAP